MRAFCAVVAAFGLVSGLLVACAGAAGVEAARGPALGVDAAASPVPAPRLGILGCVESRELKSYVLALDAERREARRAALAALGATTEDRTGAFGVTGGVGLDQSYQAEGRRFAVVAELAPHFEPRVALAKQGPVLRRIEERPRAHAVDVLACGLERCAHPPTSQRVEARPLMVELAAGESWGGSLELSYDYWRARVRYPRREACPPVESRGDEN